MYWGRGGIADALTPGDSKYPIGGRAAFGDLAGGMAIAGGIAAGLLQVARTGEAPVVDVSLLGLAMWQLSPDIVASGLYGGDPMPKFGRSASPNPLVGSYRTSDDRFITLMMLQSDRYWPEFCECVGRPDLITDERFADGGGPVRQPRGVRPRASTSSSPPRPTRSGRRCWPGCPGRGPRCRWPASWWTIPMVVANGYLARVDRDDGKSYDLVANPVQMDETADGLRAAPEHGQHTEEILLELGLDWDAIIAYKEAGAIL